MELEDANAAETTFKMPDAPVEVTAEYVRAVTGVTLDRGEVTLKVGESTTLLAAVTPVDAAVQNITWASSDDRVVSVANGEITALGAGIGDEFDVNKLRYHKVIIMA
ncbi:Ig-like domain-containing protein, partial [uncultured Muribaculum sp.]|uniref:Ig-like domain-containing protein n=1 Tax=uncultured Muribaculum sp. TaxID=1918613 RepID=UPI00322040E6